MLKNRKSRRRYRRIIGSLLLGLLWSSVPVQAQPISSIISYQGQLAGAGGAPLANGTYSLTFKIYEDNAAVFTQTSNVATVGGVFSIFLGVGALSFDATKSYEMGVTYNGTEVKHPIAAVPFALNAKSGSVQSDGTTLSGDGTAANPLAVKAGGVGQGQVSNGYVDLSSAQTVAGSKTFSSPVNTTSSQYNVNGSPVLRVAGSNLFVGRDAGLANNTGVGNTFVGRDAGESNTTGTSNAFLGASAGQSNTTGDSNAFLGTLAGYSNTSGGSNTFVGHSAGPANTEGSFNAFLGNGTGGNNTTGAFNTFVGQDSGRANSTGGTNTFIGQGAGKLNTTGGNNIALGINAGSSLTTGDNNITIGHAGTTGEAATVRLGTPGTQTRTFIAGIGDTTLTGSPVVVDGNGQLGTGTVAIANGGTGSTTQNFVDLSSHQTVGGTKTFSSAVNTSSQYNIKGNPVLSIAGSNNTFVGEIAGLNNTGSNNTFLGTLAGYQTTGSNNAFLGTSAGGSNTSGVFNTFVGTGAGAFNTTGGNNIALGVNAGLNLTTGNNNIMIGHNGNAGEAATTRIGTPSNQTRAFIAGIRGVTTGAANGVTVVIDSNGQLGTVSSSRRYKQEIKDMAAKSKGLLSLRPVTFRYKPTYVKGENPLQYGLIAEEVEKVYPELVQYDNGQVNGVKYHELPVMLLNELQKQQKELKAQQQLMQTQSQQIANLQARLARYEQQSPQTAAQPATARKSSATKAAKTKISAAP